MTMPCNLTAHVRHLVPRQLVRRSPIRRVHIVDEDTDGHTH